MMKGYTNVVKAMVGVGLLAFAAGRANATLLVNEQFNYADGALTNVSGGVWTAFSGALTSPLNVSGGQAVLTDANAQDCGISLGGAHSNDVLYGSFDVNFSVAPHGTGTYIAMFKNSATFYDPRIWATNNAGNVTLGIANAAGAPVLLATDIALGTTHKIVFKVDQTGANMVSTLWVDPALESSTSCVATDLVVSGTALVQFALRQATASVGAGTETVDNILIGTTFADVVPVPEPSTMMLVGAGLTGMFFIRRRRA
jgi:hypothetical protein